MISHISIKDFAIIEEVDIDLHPGLNIITGETGAGKSIIIEALSLALGSRADTAYVRTGRDKAIIQIIAEQGNEEFIIRREVFAAGKSICKVNGEIISVSQLSTICKKIADIHGQYDNQSLLNPEQHLPLIDRYEERTILPEKERVSFFYAQYADVRRQLHALIKNAGDTERKRDFMKFELQEIDSAKLTIGEDEELASRLLMLQNGEKIQQNLSSAYDMIYDGSPSAYEELGKSLQLLLDISGYSDDILKISDALSDCYYKLEDLVSDLRKSRDAVSFSPQELDETLSRLDLLDGLKRKYGGPIERILAYKDELQTKLEQIENADTLKEDLEKKLLNCEKELSKHSEKLSKLRKQSADDLEIKINEQLSELNFNNASLTVHFKEANENTKKAFTENGIDLAEFLIITNKGETPKPLIKIASGGEISRIMLALKSVTCEYDNIPTIVFDEIDSGISGVTASIVGKKLLQISSGRQIICITHLPQIAALSEHHYKIQKKSDDTTTRTDVVPLTHEEKIQEIARLLGGANITETTLKSAEELISLSRK